VGGPVPCKKKKRTYNAPSTLKKKAYS
jgi:hypothetical protein